MGMLEGSFLNGFKTLIQTKPNGHSSLPEGELGKQIQFVDTSVPTELYIDDPKFPYPYERTHIGLFPHLDRKALFGVATDAGAGHLRPLKALTHALSDPIERIYINTIATKTHHAGSTQPILQAATEFLQRTPFLQRNMYASIVHSLLLIEDAPRAIAAFERLIEKAKMAGKSDILMIHTNPDPAFVASFYKRQLEHAYNTHITNVVVMTDHFPANSQLIWNLIDIDIIVAPDELTAEHTQKELAYWAKKMHHLRRDRPEHRPFVMVSGYPQEPFYANTLAPHLIDARLRQLDPNYNDEVNIAIPLGGASPGMPFLADTVEALSQLPIRINPWTVFKNRKNIPTEQYYKKMTSLHAHQEMVQTNDALIDALGKKYSSDQPPTLVVVKPGELSNVALYEPSQVGGAILLFTHPVGDQEVQNKRFFQSEEGGRVLPSDGDNTKLIHFMLDILQNRQQNQSQSNELAMIVEQARYWRALALPNEPHTAALFIYALKKFGVFKAMGKYIKPHTQFEGQSDRGSFDFFSKLDEALKLIE